MGGALQTDTGRVLPHALRGQGTPIENRLQYLMFLQHAADADCFRFVKVWQVQKGLLRAKANDDMARVKLGTSQAHRKSLESILTGISLQRRP